LSGSGQRGRPIALEAGEPLELPERLDDRLPAVGGAAASAAVTRAVVSGNEDGLPGDAVADGRTAAALDALVG
jgi:hypothetical protein